MYSDATLQKLSQLASNNVFRSRGNHSEVHLSRKELAEIFVAMLRGVFGLSEAGVPQHEPRGLLSERDRIQAGCIPASATGSRTQGPAVLPTFEEVFDFLAQHYRAECFESAHHPDNPDYAGDLTRSAIADLTQDGWSVLSRHESRLGVPMIYTAKLQLLSVDFIGRHARSQHPAEHA